MLVCEAIPYKNMGEKISLINSLNKQFKRDFKDKPYKKYDLVAEDGVIIFSYKA